MLFVNDLPDCAKNKLLLFADDTKLYATNDPHSLELDLNKLTEWSEKWHLHFNISKCKHLHIGRQAPAQRIMMNERPLELADSEKDLGVTFDAKLTFKSHIIEKANKANSMFGIIRRSFRHLETKTFLPLYKGMVRSHLDFAAPVYHPSTRAEIDKIEGVQRRATKQVPGLKNLTYPERLRKLKLPTLTYRRVRADMIELYKATSGIYEPQLCSFVKMRADETERQGTRRHQKTIYPTHSNSNIRRNAFCNRNVALWNSLPGNVVNASTINTFKARLDRHWSNQPAVWDHTADINPRMPFEIENATDRIPLEVLPPARVILKYP